MDDSRSDQRARARDLGLARLRRSTRLSIVGATAQASPPVTHAPTPETETPPPATAPAPPPPVVTTAPPVATTGAT